MYKNHPVHRLIEIDSLIAVYDFPRPLGFYFQGESHDFWECVFVRNGAVTATADERVYQLTPGKLLLHKPMEFHRIWADENCAPWVTNISFEAHGELTPKLSNRCFDLQPDQQNRLFAVVSAFRQAQHAYETGDNHLYRTYTNITSSLLEAFLIDLAENTKDNTPSQSPNDERYSQIIQVMQANLRENLSLPQLAEKCQMSISNMKRIFSQYSDVGIAKYYLTLRLRYAMELLEDGMPASRVAEALHFNDNAYFYTVFKREMGITPMQYRKNKSHLPSMRPGQ